MHYDNSAVEQNEEKYRWHQQREAQTPQPRDVQVLHRQRLFQATDHTET